MFSRWILLGTLAISKYTAQEETPLFSNTDVYDSSIFSDVSSFADPTDFDGILPTDLSDPTDPTLLFLNDDPNDIFPMVADSNESCHLETSQLADTLSRRGAPIQCINPDSGNSGLNAPTIDPKVAPFVDIQTMELKTICPSGYKRPYSIAVCSSGKNGDIVLYPPNVKDFDLFWAQKSN